MKVIQINPNNKHLLNELIGKGHGTILFYHPYCSHCIALKPEWEKMKNQLKNKNCNIYEVNGEDLNEIEHPVKSMVDGFPSIINVKNDNYTSYNNQRDAFNMAQFILSNLPKQTVNSKKANNYIKKKKVTFKLNNNNNLIKSKKVLNAKNITNSILVNKKRINKQNKKTQKKRGRKPRKQNKKKN